MNDRVITFRIPEDLLSEIEGEACAAHISVSAAIRLRLIGKRLVLKSPVKDVIQNKTEEVPEKPVEEPVAQELSGVFNIPLGYDAPFSKKKQVKGFGK